jgi:hypothetical protein
MLFRRACEEGRMTADVVAGIAALLRVKGEMVAPRREEVRRSRYPAAGPAPPDRAAVLSRIGCHDTALDSLAEPTDRLR